MEALFDDAEGEVDDVLAPVLLVLREPVANAVVVGAEAQEEVLRVAQFRLGAVELAAAVGQVDRVEDVAAVVALVAAGVGVATDRAGALDITVEQEALLDRAVRELHARLVDVALLKQAEEHVLHHPCVVLGAGRGVEVPTNAESLPGIEELFVEVGGDFGRRLALLLRADGDWRSVLVAAGHHQHVVAGRAVVAGKDVSGQVGAGDLTDVKGAVAVRPGDAGKYLFGHMLRVKF